MSSGRLSRSQIELVLRRAAELEAGRSSEGPTPDSETLSEGDLVRLGEEAGLSQASLQLALSDLRRGSLVEREPDALERAIGARELVVSRDIPGPPGPVQRAVDRFLREQLMTVRRHHGQRVEWERARGLWPGLARSLDFARRYSFGPVTRVETLVSPSGPATTTVTFRIDLGELRRDRLIRACLRAGAAFSIFGLGGAMVLPGFGMPDVVALLGGGALAGGLAALERRRFEENRSTVALAPERFLDFLALEQGRRRQEPIAPVTPGATDPT